MDDASLDPRLQMGANFPPEERAAPDPFAAHSVHIDDLLTEAHNWADGTAIETPAQADEVSFLIDQLRKAKKTADAARAEEKRPHDDAAKAVQTKWKPLLDGCERAEVAAKAALTRWLTKLENEKRTAAIEARRVAEAAAAQAAAARANADRADLSAQEEVDALTAEAEQAARGAKCAEGDKAQAVGGARAMTLRSYWTAQLADGPTAARHFWLTRREECEAFFLQLAQREVNAGKRTIPGFDVIEERRAQ